MRALALIVLVMLSGPAKAENAWVASTSIRVIDLESGSLVGSVSVAPDQVIREIAFDRSGSRAYVASMGGLFVVDTTTLGVVARVSGRPTCSVAVAADTGTLAALHLQPAGEGLADRERGIPPTVTLATYDPGGTVVLAQAEVHGKPLRVRVTPDGSRLYVLDSNEAVLTVFDDVASQLGEVDLAPDAIEGQQFMCADLGLGSDGTVAVARSSTDGSAIVIVRPGESPIDSTVTVMDTGTEHRVRGAAFLPGGGTVYASAMGYMARLPISATEATWRHVGHRFAALDVSPSGTFLVMATPVFDELRGTGGVLVADPDGTPLRLIELADLSPYTLAVQP